MKAESRPSAYSDERLDQIQQSLDQCRILLFTHLEQNLVRTLLEKTTPVESPSPSASEPEKLTWTYSKVGLTELIYSLKELGVFNHGKAELKKIVHCFEYMFNVDLGNVSSSFQEILERKRDMQILRIS